MKALLRVDGSIRRAGSRSRMLGDRFLLRLQAVRPGLAVQSRDVGIEPPAAPDAAFVDANTTPAAQRTDAQRAALATSDQLIDEFMAADAIVVTTPMYNFSVGAGVKAWVDNLIRVGRTFGVGPQGLEPMATGKKLVVISTRGLGYGPDSPLAACDHLEGWFRDIFGFIGVSDCHFVQADNLDFAGPEAQIASMKRASEALEQLADALAQTA